MVQYLFQVEDFSPYKVAHPRDNRNFSRFIKRTSWCDYKSNGKTVVYLEEGEKSTVEAIYAATHEACHSLNFRKHQHYAWYKQRFYQLLGSSVLMVLLSMGEARLQWRLHHVGLLLCLFLTISAHRFLQAYRIDETQVEILTVQMVKRHLQDALTWAGDSRTPEDLLPGIRRETIRYHERIRRAANGLMLFYLLLALGYGMNDLGLVQVVLNHFIGGDLGE